MPSNGRTDVTEPIEFRIQWAVQWRHTVGTCGELPNRICNSAAFESQVVEHELISRVVRLQCFTDDDLPVHYEWSEFGESLAADLVHFAQDDETGQLMATYEIGFA